MATRKELADLVKATSEIGGEDWIPLFMYTLNKQFPEVAVELQRQVKERSNDANQRQA
jgi:hypothetical protein